MPHAERNRAHRSGHSSNKMSDTSINGEKPSSQFLSHLTSYPIVSDSITTYKSNPYGAKSISLVNSAYSTALSTLYPRLSPYLQTPYSYVKPYLVKADSLGDSGLNTLESRFPIVKENTSTIQEKVQGVAGYPFVIVGQGREFVSKTWQDQYSKSEGQGVFKAGRAVIGTELKLGAAVIEYLRVIMGKVKDESEKIVEKGKAELQGSH